LECLCSLPLTFCSLCISLVLSLFSFVNRGTTSKGHLLSNGLDR
jgi:hypothetical protein